MQSRASKLETLQKAISITMDLMEVSPLLKLLGQAAITRQTRNLGKQLPNLQWRVDPMMITETIPQDQASMSQIALTLRKSPLLILSRTTRETWACQDLSTSQGPVAISKMITNSDLQHLAILLARNNPTSMIHWVQDLATIMAMMV